MKHFGVCGATVLVSLTLTACSTGPVISEYYLPRDETTLNRVLFVPDKRSYPRDHIAEASLWNPSDTAAYGYATMETKYVESLGTMSTVGRRALVVFSGLTVTALNLLGLPMSWATEEIELELTLYDALGSRLQSYSGVGEGTGYVGYFRYTEGGAAKAASAEAVQNALLKIKNKLKADYRTINQKLQSVGPIDLDRLNTVLESHPEWESRIYIADAQKRELVALRGKIAEEENLRRLEALENYVPGQLALEDFHGQWNCEDPFKGKIGVLAVQGTTRGELIYTLGYHQIYFDSHDILSTDSFSQMKLALAVLAGQIKEDEDLAVDVDLANPDGLERAAYGKRNPETGVVTRFTYEVTPYQKRTTLASGRNRNISEKFVGLEAKYPSLRYFKTVNACKVVHTNGKLSQIRWLE